MGAAAELFVKVTADLKGLTAGFDQAGRAAKKLGDDVDAAAGHWVDANGRMRDASGKFVARAKESGDAVDGLGKKFSGLKDLLQTAGLLAAGGAMAYAGTQAVKLAGELEQNRVAFTTMLGSAAKADAMLKDLAAFAAQTPFELRGLTDSSKRLLAFGFDAKAIIPIMNSVGNAVAAVGGGKDTIDGVTLALGQMAAKGKVSAEEMNQLAERGIPAWKMLADGIGVSIPEAMKRAEKGSIDAGTAITALVNGMNTKFPGMMAKQSQTIMGALSNLQDSADAALTKIGQKLIETFNLTRVVQAMSTAISNLTAAFTSGGLLAALDKAFGPTTKAAILGIGVALTAAAIPAIAAATASLITMASAAAPFVALAGAIAFAAYPIIKNWEAIKGTITALWDTAAQYTAAYYNRAVRIASDLATNFATAFRYIGDAIRSILGDELTNKLLGGLSRATGAFRGFAEVAVAPLKAVGSVASVAASNFATTWGDAMSMSKGFTSGLFTAAASQTRDFGQKLTAEMLGIGKASAAAASSAGKAAKATSHHAAEMRKAAVEARALEAQYMRNLKTYLAQEDVTYKLRDALKVVADDQQRLGLAFDVAGAKAEVHRKILSEMEAAFGKTSLQVRSTKAAIAEFEAASKNGGAASAAAYKAIAEGADELEKARAKAAALGHEFKATDEAIKTTEATIGKLIDLGLKPGAKAYDEQIAKLAELRAAQQKVPPTMEQTIGALQKMGQAVEGVGSGVDKLIGGFGVNLPSVLTETIGGFAQGAMSVIGLASALNQAQQAMQDLDNQAKESGADGLLSTLKAIALVVGLAQAAYRGWTAYVEQNTAALQKSKEAALDVADAQSSIAANLASSNLENRLAMEQQAAHFQQTTDMVNGLNTTMVSAVKDATIAFMSGSKTWASDLRQSLRQAMFQSLLDKTIMEELGGKLKEQWGTIKGYVMNGNKEAAMALAKGLADSAEASIEPISEAVSMLLKAFGMAPSEITRLASQAKSTIDEMSRRNAEALASYGSNIQSSLNKTLERTLNRGSKTAEEASLIDRLLREQEMVQRGAYSVGMATGGLVTGPTIAKMGEGGRNEAVLPLNESVYRQIGQGIAAARGGGSGTQVVVQYYGNGKWTREDAQGLGRLLVSELRSMGVRA